MKSEAGVESERCPEPSHGEIEQKLVSLDQDGDAILEINDIDSSKTIKFLVSTKILRLSSPVFAGMFGSTFIEGQNLRNEGRVVVKLVDDNAHAMKTILEILHHHPPADIDPLMNAKELACIAIHCDKYDCRAALRPWTYYWFRDLEAVQKSSKLTLLLVAAYRFDEPRQFANISAMAVKYMQLEDLTTWYNHEMLDHFPESAADALKSKIQGLLRSLHSQVESVITALGQDKRGHEMTLQDCVHCGRTPPMEAKKCHPCNNSMLSTKYCTASYRIAEFIAILEKAELWPSLKPFDECAVSDLVYRIRCAKDDIKHTCSAGIRCPLLQQLQVLNIHAQQIQNNIQGLCLVCVKSGRWADNNKCICIASRKSRFVRPRRRDRVIRGVNDH